MSPNMVTEVASTKKKRLHRGKNKKKSWRKTDVRDIEEYLDDVRHQERTGGLLANKKDDKLFFVDKSTNKKPKKISVIERRRLRKLDKPLKCYKHLQPDNDVPPFTVPRESCKREPLFKSKRLAEKGLTKIELEALAKQVKAVKKLKKQKATYLKNRVIDFDLWDGLKDEYEGEDPFYLEYTNKKRVKVPATYTKKPSEIPAVVIPHPGASYNPAYEDHQELLHQAFKIEERRENKQKVLHKALDAMFPTAENAPTTETWLNEMSAGLGISKDDDDDDEKTKTKDDNVDDDDDDVEENEDEKTSNQPKPKTKKQRRKAKERVIETRNRKQAKLERVRENEIFKARSIRKEIKKFDEEVQQKKEMKKQEWNERAKTRVKRLGKRYFSNAELEIKLSEELPESLRSLVPEGDALTDRFVSLQRRNIIEPRIQFRKKDQKRYKPKLYEKRSHKEVPQSQGSSK